MPAAPQELSPNASLSALAAAAVASDPAVQARVKRMVNKIISQVEFTLEYGSSNDKNALMKAVVPAMMKSLASVEDDQGARAKAEAYGRLVGKVGGDE